MQLCSSGGLFQRQKNRKTFSCISANGFWIRNHAEHLILPSLRLPNRTISCDIWVQTVWYIALSVKLQIITNLHSLC